MPNSPDGAAGSAGWAQTGPAPVIARMTAMTTPQADRLIRRRYIAIPTARSRTAINATRQRSSMATFSRADTTRAHARHQPLAFSAAVPRDPLLAATDRRRIGHRARNGEEPCHLDLPQTQGVVAR